MTTSGTGTATATDLRRRLTGRVLEPHDDGYDDARTVMAGHVDAHPALIVRPADDADVAATIAFARTTGLPLAVRSGGHSGAGHSTVEGGIVLDLRDMTAIDIDVTGRTAWVEAGLTAGEVTAAAATYGLVVPFGDTGSVGLGGLTLGGGVGYLARKHGLTIDSLLAADVVTADGDVLRVDAASHPDLFWAIRGGGGNFGVATRFRFRLHALDQVVGGILVLPATAATLAGFVAAAESAPDELTAIANVMSCPPLPFVGAEHHGTVVMLAMMCWSGDVETGRAAMAPFLALAEPLADLVRPMAYPEMFPPEDPDYRPTAVGKTVFVDTMGAERGRSARREPAGVRRVDAGGAGAGARRRDGPGAGRRDGVRAPHASPDGEHRGVLRRRRRPRGASRLGGRGGRPSA